MVGFLIFLFSPLGIAIMFVVAIVATMIWSMNDAKKKAPAERARYQASAQYRKPKSD